MTKEEREPTNARRQAIIDVTDTAWAVRQWFASHEQNATPADIVAMTALVLARESKPPNQFILQPNHRAEVAGETAVVEPVDAEANAAWLLSQRAEIRNQLNVIIRKEVEAGFKRLEAENKDLTGRLAKALVQIRKLEGK